MKRRKKTVPSHKDLMSQKRKQKRGMASTKERGEGKRGKVEENYGISSGPKRRPNPNRIADTCADTECFFYKKKIKNERSHRPLKCILYPVYGIIDILLLLSSSHFPGCLKKKSFDSVAKANFTYGIWK